MNRELLKQALEALEMHVLGFDGVRKMELAIEALESELAKPEQEPVAFLFDDMTWTCQKSWTNEITGGTPVYAKPFKNYEEPVAWMEKEDCGDMTFTLVKPTYDNDLIPLYTAPPRKPWVGLSSEDWEKTLDFQKEGCERDAEIFDWIEKTLEEKNK